jgi:hypothetical protein
LPAAVRRLSRKSVELMRTDHLGEKYQGDAAGFGLRFWVNTQRMPAGGSDLNQRGKIAMY